MTEPAVKFEPTNADAAALDRALFELVACRVEAGAAQFDPAHEAKTMRALAQSWRGSVPASVGLQVYRELIGASLRRHSSVSLHVADAEREVAELARAHFGFAMPMTVYPTASLVVQALAEDRLAIGVVPVPRSDHRQAGWWSNLSAPHGNGPRIVAKLPFFQNDGSAVHHPPSYALASVPVTATGDDTTLLVVFLRGEMSRPKLGQVLKASTLDAKIMAMGHDQPERSPTRFLIEASGFLGISDPRINALKAHGGEEIADIAVVGAYANPVRFGGPKS